MTRILDLSDIQIHSLSELHLSQILSQSESYNNTENWAIIRNSLKSAPPNYKTVRWKHFHAENFEWKEKNNIFAFDCDVGLTAGEEFKHLFHIITIIINTFMFCQEINRVRLKNTF